MLQKLLSGDGGSGPPSPGISLIACDLQRSLNILTLPLDVAADDADDADDADAHTPLCDYVPMPDLLQNLCQVMVALGHRHLT